MEILRQEIENEFEELSRLNIGSDEYKVCVEGVTKLLDREIALKKLEMDRQEKAISRDVDTELKLKEMEDESRDRKIKNWLTFSGILIPTSVTVWGIVKSLKFEETGSITTVIGRGLFNKILKK